MSHAMTNTTVALTMTSREIAELTGKQHAHVMRDIRTMMEELSMNPNLDSCAKSSTYTGKDGRKYDQYELDKDTCLTLLLGYDAVARMKVVKRWQFLEEQASANAIPQTLPDALRLAADLAEQKAQVQSLLAIAAPKAQALDRLADADGLMNCTVAAKTLQVPPKRLFDYLRQHQWIYRRPGGSGNVAYQDKIAAGLLTHKVTTVQREDGTEKVVEQVLVTSKGLAKLSEAMECH